MAKIIIRDKLKFRIFPKILWIDNEKIKLKSNSETIFETDEKYVILSESKAKNRRLGIDLENKKEILIEIKYDFFRLITVFLIIPIFAVIVKLFLLSDVEASHLGTFAGVLIVVLWKREKFEVFEN